MIVIVKKPVLSGVVDDRGGVHLTIGEGSSSLFMDYDTVEEFEEFAEQIRSLLIQAELKRTKMDPEVLEHLTNRDTVFVGEIPVTGE